MDYGVEQHMITIKMKNGANVTTMVFHVHKQQLEETQMDLAATSHLCT
jgi:hypothetical protein